MTFYYYLINPTKDRTSVFISISHGKGFRFQGATGLTCEPKEFNSKTGKFKKNLNFNEYLNDLGKAVKRHFEENVNEKSYASAKEFKADYKNVIRDFKLNKRGKTQKPIKKEDEQKEKTVIEHFEDFRDKRKKSGAFTLGTIKNYNSSIKNLKDFEKAKKKKLYFNDMNQEFFENYTGFLAKKGKQKNTIGNLVKTLKAFLKYAYIQKINPFDDFRESFKVWKIDTKKYYIFTIEELNKIKNMDFSKNRTLDKTRDLFMIQNFTGLRVSDLMRLNEASIDYKKMNFKISPKKSPDEELTIPILPQIQDIFLKYKGYKLPSYAIQRFNTNLKKLGKKADFMQDIKYNIILGSHTSVNCNVKAWELFQSHNARRSFITNALKFGMIPEEIQKITGQKTRAVLDKYVKIAKEDAQESMTRAFSGK